MRALALLGLVICLPVSASVVPHGQKLTLFRDFVLAEQLPSGFKLWKLQDFDLGSVTADNLDVGKKLSSSLVAQTFSCREIENDCSIGDNTLVQDSSSTNIAVQPAAFLLHFPDSINNRRVFVSLSDKNGSKVEDSSSPACGHWFVLKDSVGGSSDSLYICIDTTLVKNVYGDEDERVVERVSPSFVVPDSSGETPDSVNRRAGLTLRVAGLSPKKPNTDQKSVAGDQPSPGIYSNRINLTFTL